MHVVPIDAALRASPLSAMPQGLEGTMAREVQVMTVALVFLFLGAFVVGVF